MSFLNELISKESNEELREQLQERLDIVAHKIKFMDKVPICFLDSLGQPHVIFSDFAEYGGVVLTTNPMEAVYIVFYEKDKQLGHLMGTASALLHNEWPAVKYNRICLLADDYEMEKASDAVSLIEDMAEMVHPGHFIFGYEGDKWIRFQPL